jgi:hypothetical protein
MKRRQVLAGLQRSPALVSSVSTPKTARVARVAGSCSAAWLAIEEKRKEKKKIRQTQTRYRKMS